MKRAFAFAVLAAAACAAPAAAQNCPSGTDLTFKNDNLPLVPVGPIAASVIPGLCEGEAIGAVFTLPPGSPPQKLLQVSVGFGHGSGVGGFQALLNVEIYDGITWSSGIPTLGPKVYDLNADQQTDMQVFTHGLNLLDLSGEDVTVGNGTNKYVVAFRMNFNPTGTCGTGHPANFMTDNSCALFCACSSGSQKNLVDLQGQAWRDVSTAMVSGFALCPLFINGNWLIRACTEEAQVCQADLGFQGLGPATLSMCGGDLSTGTTSDLEISPVVAGNTIMLFGGFTLSPVPVWELQSQLTPIPPAFVIAFVPPAPFVSIPISGGGGPGSVYLQAVIQGAGVPTPSGWYATNTIRADFLP
jgi:hypothetical protein